MYHRFLAYGAREGFATGMVATLARLWIGISLTVLVACGAAAGSTTRVGAKPVDVAVVRVSLIDRANAERAQRGLAPLEVDATLDAIALRHSEDMRDAKFVGHDSPTTGTPADRVEHAGLGRMLVLENVARGVDAEALWTSFSTVSQRDNMRNPQPTHSGLGIAVEHGEQGVLLFATQVFVQFAREIDVAAAPAKVRVFVDQARRARGLGALLSDARLGEAAETAAKEFFSDPASSESDIVARTNQRLAAVGDTYRTAGTVTGIVRVLDEAAALEPSLDDGARVIGVGVAQGTRADTGPHAIAVVLVWAK